MRVYFLNDFVRPNLIYLLSAIGAIMMFVLSHTNGMPVKRWTFLGSLVGPLAILLFSVHLRRAWMKINKEMPCIGWRA